MFGLIILSASKSIEVGQLRKMSVDIKCFTEPKGTFSCILPYQQ